MSITTGAYNQPGQPPQYLFQRDWSVQIIPIGPLPGPLRDKYGNPLYQLLTDQAVIYSRQQQSQNPPNKNGPFNNLRISFNFQLSLVGQADEAVLKVYNFNSQSRELYQKGCRIIISAGYVGLMKQILIGETKSSKIMTEKKKSDAPGSVRQGTDIVTTFNLGVSQRQFETNIFYNSYPANTTILTILRDLASALGVSKATLIGIDENTYFYRPQTFTYTVKAALNRMTIGNNLQWTVINDELIIMPFGYCFNPNAIVLSSGTNPDGTPTTNTGLIGLPFQAQGGIVNFSCLLNPDIIPGQLVQLISRNVNGFFIVRNARYVGDSYGKDWHIECECYPENRVNTSVINVNQVQSQNAGLAIGGGI